MNKKWLSLCLIPFLVACSANKEEEINPPSVSEKSEISEENVKNISPLTGMEMTKTNNQHFAVMIENSPEARPQTGLINADIVYEMKTEGNISRYLALFHDNIPDVIGPIRSSRHYFIPLAEDMNSLYIHFGASSYAYKYLKSSEMKVPSIDGISNGNFFFRDSSRKAPHNAYLKTETLKKNYDLTIKNEHFTFKNTGMEDGNGEAANIIEFKYNDFTNIKYTYEEKDKMYLRFQQGTPHIDRNTNEQIKVKNIIFQYAKHENLNDKYGRIDILLVGEGDILYVSEGKQLKGKWKKSDKNSNTVYYDNEGNVLNVNPGNTWIQIVNADSSINTK